MNQSAQIPKQPYKFPTMVLKLCKWLQYWMLIKIQCAHLKIQFVTYLYGYQFTTFSYYPATNNNYKYLKNVVTSDGDHWLNTIKRWWYQRMCTKETSFQFGSIVSCLEGRYKTCKQYTTFMISIHKSQLSQLDWTILGYRLGHRHIVVVMIGLCYMSTYINRVSFPITLIQMVQKNGIKTH